jgi:hypothetical protein
MRKEGAEPFVQPVKGDMVSIGELVEQPKHAMHLDLLLQCEFPQSAVASEQCPSARFSNCEGERVWDRKTCVLASNGGRSGKLRRCQDLDSKSQRRQLFAKWAGEFSGIKKVRNRKLIRQQISSRSRLRSRSISADVSVRDPSA